MVVLLRVVAVIGIVGRPVTVVDGTVGVIGDGLVDVLGVCQSREGRAGIGDVDRIASV